MDDKYESKFISEVKCISLVEIKEEVIIPENISDSESTLSDNDKSSDECIICCKYHSMFIILKNHECQFIETEKTCTFCDEISHWLNCFKNHKESHMLEFDSSDSTLSDREESIEKCKICLKYEFMVPLLKSHVCKVNKRTNNKCQDCSEVLDWLACYEKHVESHDNKFNELKIKDENLSDSTISDNEEIQKFLCHTNANILEQCIICIKYEIMSKILEENHSCQKRKNNKTCVECDEIIQWHECFENHRKIHISKKNFKNDEKVNDLHGCLGGKFDCGICLKLNSIVISLVKNHACVNSKCCLICQEVSYWLSCLKNHKQSEKESSFSDTSDGEELGIIKSSWQETDCAVCFKFRSIIIQLATHVCHQRKGKHKCKICLEISFWSKNFKLHENHHSMQFSSLKKFFSCCDCGKRFSGEKMLNVHKSYCRNSYFKCELCDKKFVNFFALKKHKIIHLCPSPLISLQYKCNICKKIFLNSSDLKNHKEIHINLKLYKCEECLIEFKSEFSLKKHNRIHR